MRRPSTPSSSSALRPLALVLLGFLALFGLESCSWSPTKRQAQYMIQDGPGKRYYGNPEEEEYVTIGDTIRILDVNHPELSMNRQVGIDGTVLLPEVGRITVAGYRRSEVEAILKQRYGPYFLDLAPDIVVDISISNRSYFVIGEVAREGPYPFTGNQTVFEAVIGARPKRDSANLGRVLLIRPDPRDPLKLQFNLRDYVPGGDSSTNYRIQENDIVYVPPTLVAQFGYFLRGMLFPVTTVFQALGGALFAFNNQGVNGRNRNNRNLVGFGGIF
ncbi:MAG: polysaccharide biosynthesis/export family protein [Planctomycetota bacterium]